MQCKVFESQTQKHDTIANCNLLRDRTIPKGRKNREKNDEEEEERNKKPLQMNMIFSRVLWPSNYELTEANYVRDDLCSQFHLLGREKKTFFVCVFRYDNWISMENAEIKAVHRHSLKIEHRFLIHWRSSIEINCVRCQWTKKR